MYIEGDHAELVVGGRLDVRSAADARASLHNALDGGQGDLVLDLGGLDSWDATGLGVIMGAHRRAGRSGRRLVLRSVPPQMQRLLVATRLHRILAIEGGGGASAPYGEDGQESGRYGSEGRETAPNLARARENRTYRRERYSSYERREQVGSGRSRPTAVHERQRIEHAAREDGGHEGGTLTKP